MSTTPAPVACLHCGGTEGYCYDVVQAYTQVRGWQGRDDDRCYTFDEQVKSKRRYRCVECGHRLTLAWLRKNVPGDFLLDFT